MGTLWLRSQPVWCCDAVHLTRSSEDEDVQCSVGIWHGYLFFLEIPDFAEFVKKCEWDAPREQHQVTGFYKTWRVRFSFDPDHHSRPTRFETEQAAQGVGKDQPYASYSRMIEFSNWMKFDGIEAPGRNLVWDVGTNHKGEALTSTSTIDLEKSGSVAEVSDRQSDFFTDVPNGTPVQVNDYLGIDFIWKDGEIVRKVDSVKLAIADRAAIFGSPFRRYLMMALGLCLLAGAEWLVWRRPVRSAMPPSSTGRLQEGDAMSVVPEGRVRVSVVGFVVAMLIACDLSTLAWSQDHYCGVYSAYSVLDHYQRKVAFESLLEPKYVSGFQGDTTAEVAQALTDHGVAAIHSSGLGVFDLRAANGPMILHVGGNQGTRRYEG